MNMRLAAMLVALLLAAASASAQAPEFAVWPGVAPGMVDPPAREVVSDDGGSFTNVMHPTLTAFYAARPTGAAIVVVPGGGYNHVVFTKEGTEIAERFAAMGIDAYVLKYRLPEETFNPPSAAFQDAQRALRLLRSGAIAADRHTDPHRIGIIGFSAGGNTAGVLGTYYDSKFYEPVDAADKVSARPDFMILGYPSIFAKSEFPEHFPADWNARGQRFWKISSPFPFDTAINARTPPTFVFVGDGDNRLPYQRAIDAASYLRRAGVPVELHVFAGAPHGFGIRGTGPEKEWPELCGKWLKAQGIIP
jgi:acetyl esterase/lipase